MRRKQISKTLVHVTPLASVDTWEISFTVTNNSVLNVQLSADTICDYSTRQVTACFKAFNVEKLIERARPIVHDTCDVKNMRMQFQDGHVKTVEHFSTENVRAQVSQKVNVGKLVLFNQVFLTSELSHPFDTTVVTPRGPVCVALTDVRATPLQRCERSRSTESS